ncbi:MAG TPA: HepT-like ribonuclease domain-containing protein [Acidimicrobiales bacterium]|nr:HepT-like ribonuclease domain-containing protein [Acidimicrobiales bacterium]
MKTWRGPTLYLDAVRVRLIEIGEAVRGASPDLLASEPAVPWAQVAAMRNHLTHQYFDTSHAIVAATVSTDLPLLAESVQMLLDRLGPSGEVGGVTPTDQSHRGAR